MRTTATRDGDDYVINGEKHYINNADEANFAIVLAATDRSKGSHGGISAFIVDMDTPGNLIADIILNFHRRRLWKILFDNVQSELSVSSLAREWAFAWDRRRLALRGSDKLQELLALQIAVSNLRAVTQNRE